MGKFPVVFITLKQVDGSEFERAYGLGLWRIKNGFYYLY